MSPLEIISPPHSFFPRPVVTLLYRPLTLPVHTYLPGAVDRMARRGLPSTDVHVGGRGVCGPGPDPPGGRRRRGRGSRGGDEAGIQVGGAGAVQQAGGKREGRGAVSLPQRSVTRHKCDYTMIPLSPRSPLSSSPAPPRLQVSGPSAPPGQEPGPGGPSRLPEAAGGLRAAAGGRRGGGAGHAGECGAVDQQGVNPAC